MTLAVAFSFVACGGNQNNGDQVAYGGIGSGGGVRNLRDKIVDFAGSDAFLFLMCELHECGEQFRYFGIYVNNYAFSFSRFILGTR